MKQGHQRFINPPGCLTEVLSHPISGSGAIELALIQEHRFAFCYWTKWTNALNGQIPSLVTFDWHQDLCPPYEDQVAEMKALDVRNNADVALYAWQKLSHHNDVQINAAIKHNVVKDVYVICRQNVNRNKKETIKDFYGNSHRVYIFKTVEEFEQKIPRIRDKEIYFDIDLDYFTLSNPLSVGCPFKLQKFTYMRKEEVVKLMSVANPTIQWIFERLAGFTIATEPSCCGGLKKSNNLLNILDRLYFTPSLFHSNPGLAYTKWRHLT